jgi:outer membrane protein assembly factor BamB
VGWRQRVLVGVSVAAAGISITAATSPRLPAVAAAAPPSQSVATATSTTLTSSSASSSYDSRVTFTAKVSASAGTPTGTVTFTDTSNGSILDTTGLANGAASFATAALAPGSRSIVAHYDGSGAFGPSSSAALDIPVAAAGSDAIAYQVDPGHSGRQARGVLNASSLTKKWTVTLGTANPSKPTAGNVSYPLVARGRVFVTVENSQATGTTLDALDASTGAVDWSAGLPGPYGFSALAYDGRDVFALSYNGLLTAFAAGTGHELWTVQLAQSTAPPTAYDGVVYVSVNQELSAVSEADGVIRWGAGVLTGDASSPAVDDTGAYVSYDCQQDYRFSLGGLVAWHYSTACSGGGGSTAALGGGSVYARGENGSDTPVILSKTSGTLSGTFTSATAPAFDSTNMYTLQNGKLVATAHSGSPNRWTFGNGTLVTAPVVHGGVVYAGSSDGTVHGVSASSGAQVWAGSAGSAILGPHEGSPFAVVIGMAIGGGLLVVPAGPQLTAFGG